MQTVAKSMQAQFDKMCQTGKLFKSSIPGTKVWELYLEKFSKEDDPVFRDPESSTHNCNYCNNFVRRYGNVVAIDKDYNIMTIWDVDVSDEYQNSFASISALLKESQIEDVFFEHITMLLKLNYGHSLFPKTHTRLGVAKNAKRYTKEEADKFGVVKPNEIRNFHHMYLDVPNIFVLTGSKSIEANASDYRDAKNVFKRGLEEISLDTFDLVKDLISQGSLLDGQTHLFKIKSFVTFATEYAVLPTSVKDNWCWVNSYKLPIAKFRNELIGTLCSDLAQGMEINQACQTWNKRVDPVNYMKTTAPITKRQIEEAQKFVEENGFTESFTRRHATIDDIKASEILHVNTGSGALPSVSIFDAVKSTSTRHKKSEFIGIEEVSIEKFMKDILPSCTSVEAFLTNNHEGNLVSLTTANDKASKPIFKWPNNYSWTFNGNLAGKSQIKQAVKVAGGNVDGILRFSMIWNEERGTDNSDLDAWCEQPNGERIGFSTGFRRDRGNTFSSMKGQLDLDNTNPGGRMAVENIYFVDAKYMKDGIYRFWVNQYSARNSKGFKAEIEINGEIYSYEYNNPVKGNVSVAEVTLKNGAFEIKHLLPESYSSKEIYGLTTEQFHKVNLVCLSPNHWEPSSVGNKHYFFMLDKCKNPEDIRSFHAENLIPELAEHRKVLEVLGNTTMIKPGDKQLSGLGFNATVRDEVVLRLQGSHKRVIKVKF